MTFSLDISCSKCCSKDVLVEKEMNSRMGWGGNAYEYPSGAWIFKCKTCGNDDKIWPTMV